MSEKTPSFTIHFAQPDPWAKKAWPVHVDESMKVLSGLGEDDGAYLIGFGPAGDQSITVMATDAIADPQSVVGLTPTFTNGGSMFLWDVPVSHLDIDEGE